MLEVLVSVFIISLGLLGVAALIPLGKLAISETNIADRTGTLGRAALRDVEVRRMLDYNKWTGSAGNVAGANTTIGAIALDPLGRMYNTASPWAIGGLFPRYTFSCWTATELESLFFGQDDLPFAPSDTPTDPIYNGERPVLAGVGSEGNFTWFMTICPSRSDRNLAIPVLLRRDYDVSVVVCHKRDFTGGEYSSPASFLGGIGFGGGTINVSTPAILEHIKTDQWVMLADAAGGSTAKWYRVVGVGNASTPYVSLVGPDWDVSIAPTLVIVEGVTGVYTTTIHLDNDCTWTR